MSAALTVAAGRLATARAAALFLGAAGLTGCAATWALTGAALLPSYLFAVQFWITLPLGCLAVLMLHYITGGRWGIAAGRTLRASAATVPVMALLFIPLLFGLDTIFPWVAAGADTMSPVVEKKMLYLNPPFLIGRTALYFLIWLSLAGAVHVWTDIDRGRIVNERARSRRRAWSAFGLMLWGLTVTFFAVDWMMALDPVWYSTIFGFLIAGGMAANTFALVILSTSCFGAWDETPADAVADRRQDLCNFLLSFILVWFYLAYMQYLIIWSGNLPHEIEWYIHRGEPGWLPVILLIAALHFVLPFAALISPAVKRSAKGAAIAAALLLAGSALHLYWVILPAFHPHGFALPWPVAPAFLGVGGLWVASFLWLLDGHRLWPFPARRKEVAHA